MTRNAFVISGGGAHGDFEVGVIQYLYAKTIKPSIIVGTSVGAVNGAKLAESDVAGDATRGLPGLLAIWRGLQTNESMWQYETWYADGSDDAKALAIETVATIAATVMFGVIGFAIGAIVTGAEADKHVEAIRAARSLSNLGPLIKLMAQLDQDKVEKSGIELRLATVALGDGKLRFVDQHRRLRERDDSPTQIPDPAKAAAIRGQILRIDNELAGVQFEFDTTRRAALRKQLATLLAELATVPKVQAPAIKSLADGVLASASIPYVFPPVQLNDDWYVDGGIRAQEPIGAAVAFKPDQVYAISSSKRTIGRGHHALDNTPITDYAPGNACILDIAARAAEDIMPDENLVRDLSPQIPWPVPVVVIEPDFDLHDIMTIDPGLIDIRMAHGFMRADDTLQAYAKDRNGYLATVALYGLDRKEYEIITKRFAIWRAEYDIAGQKLEFDGGTLTAEGATGTLKKATPTNGTQTARTAAHDHVKQMKRELRTLVEERIATGGAVPPDVSTWWLAYERHPFAITIPLWTAADPFEAPPVPHIPIPK